VKKKKKNLSQAPFEQLLVLSLILSQSVLFISYLVKKLKFWFKKKKIGSVLRPNAKGLEI